LSFVFELYLKLDVVVVIEDFVIRFLKTSQMGNEKLDEVRKFTSIEGRKLAAGVSSLSNASLGGWWSSATISASTATSDCASPLIAGLSGFGWTAVSSCGSALSCPSVFAFSWLFNQVLTVVRILLLGLQMSSVKGLCSHFGQLEFRCSSKPVCG
jgi:hypothetical protein